MNYLIEQILESDIKVNLNVRTDYLAQYFDDLIIYKFRGPCSDRVKELNKFTLRHT